MYIYKLSKLQVSEVLHVAQFPFVPDVSCTITSKPLKSEKQTLVANSTAFARRIARLGDT